jgi:hypothetical protein
MGDVTLFPKRWVIGCAVYVLVVMALGVGAAVGRGDIASAFYMAATVATMPGLVILAPAFYMVFLGAGALTISLGMDGSGPAWVLPVLSLGYGTAAFLNVVLLRLLVCGTRSGWARRRSLSSRPTA